MPSLAAIRELSPLTAERPWLLLLALPLLGLLFLAMRASRSDLDGPRRSVSTALRVAVAVLLVAALAGSTLRYRNPALAVIFALDVSRSVPADEVTRGKQFVTEALGAMKPSDRAGIVMFGDDAVMERAPTARHDGGHAPPTWDARPSVNGSDLQAALELAVASMPSGTEKRVVFLTDGLQNAGNVMDAAFGARAAEASVSVVPLGGAATARDIYVDALQAPPSAKEGETFELRVVLRASGDLGPTKTLLRVYRDRTFLGQQEVVVEPGKPAVMRALQTLKEGGFYRYRAEIVPPAAADSVVENDVGHAFVGVEGKPRVLLAGGTGEDAAALRAALEGSEVPVTVVGPSAIPTTLEEMAGYRAIVLANVSALDLSPGQGEHLRSYVRDLGGGLVMTGGEQSFGPGGYYRTPVEEALPVDMDVKNRKYFPTVAMALVIDKSGSMGAMDDRASKMAMAREAAALTVSLLTGSDEVTIIAFDSAAQLVVPLVKVTNKNQVMTDIGTIRQGGGTDIYPGLDMAYDTLVKSGAGAKHVILVSDGMSAPGDYVGLTKKMHLAGMTVSALAIGDDADLVTMKEIADLGSGRFYVVNDIGNIPKVFTKETILASRSFLVEESFAAVPARASEILKGVDLGTAPKLHGYVATTAKDRAEVLLKTHRGDPLLAVWRHGLGKAAAFTSDAKARWASDWLGWEGSGKLWSQAVRWTVSTVGTEGLHVQAVLDRGDLVVSAEATDEVGRHLNFLDVGARIVRPEGPVEELALGQVGPGRYVGRTRARVPGTYLVGATARSEGEVVGQRLSGASLSYPAEFRVAGRDAALLSRVAEATGGRVLERPREAFVHDLGRHPLRVPIWRGLVMAALILFVLDVAVRRVMLPDTFYERLAAPFRALRRRGGTGATHLSGIRERVSSKRRRGPLPEATAAPDGSADPTPAAVSPALVRGRAEQATNVAPGPVPGNADSATPGSPSGAEPSGAPGPRTLGSRLLDAKKRAQKP